MAKFDNTGPETTGIRSKDLLTDVVYRQILTILQAINQGDDRKYIALVDNMLETLEILGISDDKFFKKEMKEITKFMDMVKNRRPTEKKRAVLVASKMKYVAGMRFLSRSGYAPVGIEEEVIE